MKTRFPPSPTGFLHVGGLRTALYNFLVAKQTKGEFLLRIEDTDQEREVPGAVEDFLTSLHWAGLDPDEGVMLKDGVVSEVGTHGPYIQSERLSLYREHAEKLLASGHAYRCFCTSERLEEMRKAQEVKKQAPMYDRTCLKLDPVESQKRASAGEKHVVRLKVPHERLIVVDDDVRGQVKFQAHTVDDQVLLKSDGFPTYHLANVVDDHLMEIDLVLRGEEWLSSLPKHILLYEAFGWTAPRFAHVPLLLNKDKTKLSKRQGSVAVRDYIAKGYLPEAMVNFLALLGWNPGTMQEILSLQELIDAFSLERVQKAGAVFDLEKLDWIQGQWIRKIPLQEFAERALAHMAEKFPAAKSDKQFAEKVALIQERITFFSEAPEMLQFFYEEPSVSLNLLVNEKQKVTKEILGEALALLFATLEKIPAKDWNQKNIEKHLDAALEKSSLTRGQLLWPLRVALTGLPYSPGAYEVAAALEKEIVTKRLQSAKKLT